jgi:hypothetical protein
MKQVTNENKYNEYYKKIFSNVRPNSTFLSIKEYTNNAGEIANYTICFNVSYKNAIAKSYEIIDSLDLNKIKKFKKSILKEAKTELLSSFEESLNGENKDYTNSEVYSNIYDYDGKLITGLKLHKSDNILHINGIKVSKNVVLPGFYKDVNSSDKTLAKKYLKSLTPLNNFIQLKLQPARFKELSVDKMTIKK